MPLSYRILFSLALTAIPALAQTPTQVPPKRSSQIKNGFGINSNLPRDPYLPWNRWWWTRMFDAGVSWIRIGQYENSSDYTSWDWVEQTRGVYSIPPEVDDYIDSLVDNGVKIQVQLQYGNPMYTSPSRISPDAIAPEPGSFHNDDRSLNSVFWPPKTPDQIEAFIKYVKFVVNHFRGRILYYALWNEQDITYWNPIGNAEEYGRLLEAFVPTVHETDPPAKVIYGGLADPFSDFAHRSLDACQCAADRCVRLSHLSWLRPESESGVHGRRPTVPSRRRSCAMVRNYPGMRKDIDSGTTSSIPSRPGRVPTSPCRRSTCHVVIVYNRAAGVRTFVWLLTAGVDGNEYDDFGIIHGRRDLPDDFTPRPVYLRVSEYQCAVRRYEIGCVDRHRAYRRPDRSDARARRQFLRYGFRNKNGKAIVAYWVAAHSDPGGSFRAPDGDSEAEEQSDIQKPVLIDVVSGDITPI